MLDNELDLIEASRKGQNEAFGELYDEYIQKIYRFIFFKTHHKETAEDLTSQVFIKAFEKIKSYDAGKSSFAVWLYRIARNTVIDYYRTRKSDANVEDVWDLFKDESLLKDVDNKIQLEKVGKYLQTLEPLQREMIIMRVWNDLSYKEISQIINKSEANCRVIFMRAVGKLKDKVPFAIYIALLLNNLKN